MNITRSDDGKTIKIELIGEVNSINVTEIEDTLIKEMETASNIIFDLSQLYYISSAGLRMLRKLQQMMKTRGNMVINNVNSDVMEILKVTGFIRMLNVSNEK